MCAYILFDFSFVMTQDEHWLLKYHEVMAFMEANHRNPSKYDPQERGLYYNWIKHNKKLLNAGKMKEERVEMFEKVVDKMEELKRVN